MKLHKFIVSVALMLLPMMLFAQNNVQKREMRSAWVATVWQLDWPQTLINMSGNATQIERQKSQITTLLDSLYVNNFNAINFQVRSRSDAMYRSSYESWSSDLVKERGMDPGYDPLEYVVAECHKRGMECHAWLNPYRYESVQHAWDSDPTAWRNTHPEWIMDYNGAAILNPGLPEVTQLICDIIKEIVQNYDVDGILFDDYFYLNGTPASLDADLYSAYTAGGGKLSQNNWRRQNVNNMIASVNRTIKEVKPWVRFGVSPAGIACTSKSVAQGHGVTPCPTGSDWQYNDICSDPVAWVKNQDLDYISPQIYWTTTYSTNYTKATKWWSEIAHQFDRHLYVSHSISSLTASSKAPGKSTLEADIEARKAIARASGNGSDTYAEFALQVENNREYNLDDAPGSLFYSAKYLYRTSPKFAHYLRNHVFTTRALVPSMPWMTAPKQGMVENIERNGSKLTWNGVEGMRYTVYAFPSSMPAQNFIRESEYLLGVTYEPEFTLPSGQLAGMQYAVCILDRYGNEYNPALLGVPTTALDAPVLTFPENNATIEVHFDFAWNAVEGASEYIVEVSDDPTMATYLDQRSTTATSISTEKFVTLPIDKPLYWRVRSCGASKADGVSEIRKMNVENLLITAPEHAATNLSLTPTFEYSIPDRDVTLEISDSDDFEEANIVYTVEGRGSIKVPRFTLFAATTYYARMRYVHSGIEMVTPVITFTTLEMDPVEPTIAHPVNGGVLHANERIRLNDVEGCTALQVQISESTSFPARKSYLSPNVSLTTMEDNKDASAIKISSKNLQDGVTYYVHAQSSYRKLDQTLVRSEYGEVVSFTYSSTPSGVDNPTAENALVSIDGRNISVLADVESIEVYDVAGTEVANYGARTSGDNIVLDVNAGVYILKAIADNNSVVIKIALQ